MEGQTQQSTLVGTRIDNGADVQERVWSEPAIGHDANAALLLDHEQATRAVAGVSGVNRTHEAVHHDIGGEAAEHR